MVFVEPRRKGILSWTRNDPVTRWCFKLNAVVAKTLLCLCVGRFLRLNASDVET